jgi:hypothetical protein
VTERVAIERLGARADGIAHLGGQAVYVPYALPGEAVLIEPDGSRSRLVEVQTPSRPTGSIPSAPISSLAAAALPNTSLSLSMRAGNGGCSPLRLNVPPSKPRWIR